MTDTAPPAAAAVTDRRTYRIPYLRRPTLAVPRSAPRVGLGQEKAVDLQEIGRRMVDQLLWSSGTVESLLDLYPDDQSRPSADTLAATFQRENSLIGLTSLELADRYDIVVVEQGYGGVYVHTIELIKQLRKRWRVLLICPEEPLFGEPRHEDDVTVQRLQDAAPDLGYYGFVQAARALLATIPCDLLLLTHRSQSLFLFDRLHTQKSVIYCDGFYDAALRAGEDCRLIYNRDSHRRALQELHYHLGNSSQTHFGLSASPTNNRYVMLAAYTAVKAATENWCWGDRQTQNFKEGFPSIADRIHFRLPFTNPDLFDEEKAQPERGLVLFTTTMHNIDRKGLPELLEAMPKLRDFRVRCVVRQPDKLPPIPDAQREQMEIGPVPKTEMIDLYHRVWVNCRPSREESSPVSILESMICRVPQIVSPTVAEQIPIMQDGVTGFIVDPDDGERLAKCIQMVLDDPQLRDNMGHNCRQRAARYAIEHRWDEFERLLP